MYRSQYRYLRPAGIISPASAEKAVAEKMANGAPDDVTETRQQTELLIVEGKSAADALDQIRNRQMQGIYYLQGKIPNPAKLNAARMQAHEQLGPLHTLLEASACNEDRTDHRGGKLNTDAIHYNSGYDSIILVPDPDVDGQHNRLLLLQWFAKFLPQLIHEQRLRVFPTPFERCILESGQYQYRTLDEYSAQRTKSSDAIGSSNCQATRFKGLASINRDELASLLCYPLSPRSRLLTLGGDQ